MNSPLMWRGDADTENVRGRGRSRGDRVHAARCSERRVITSEPPVTERRAGATGGRTIMCYRYAPGAGCLSGEVSSCCKITTYRAFSDRDRTDRPRFDAGDAPRAGEPCRVSHGVAA